MALSYSSEDTTGHTHMSNWLLALYFSFDFLICLQATKLDEH